MGMNVREATEHWVREFNEYPRNMIEELMNIDPYDWEEVTDIEINDTEYRMIGKLPSWGTLWSFGSWLDEMWLDNYDGISKMSKLGFVIFKSKKYGYFFGIDGGGYDFYTEHWTPLYKERGLHWHEEEEE